MQNYQSIIKAGWTNFKRNSFLSFAVTGQMAIALLVLLALASFQFVTDEAVSSLEGKLDVSAYFRVDAPEEKILEMKEDLEGMPAVAEVEFVSRETALAEFKERHKDDDRIQEALEQLDDNPLGVTLNIKAMDSEQYPVITSALKEHEHSALIETVEENSAVINRINSFARTVRIGGILIALIIGIIATLVTFNTVRLTIYNQKQEIEIMRLVGASNWHIRGPYLAEGGIYGLLAAVVALIIFYPVLFAISDNVSVLISGSDIFHYFLVNSWQIALISIAVGISMGVISSFVAIRKHLRI